MASEDDHKRKVQRAAGYRTAKRSGDPASDAETNADSRPSSVEDLAVKAEAEIRFATARGEFDNLSLAGKPLPRLYRDHDPDWWIKGLIEREQLTGLAPEPFLLRKEDAELDNRLAAQPSETAVRGMVQEFNARVINARRQLLGGPPVVTPTRDVEQEVAKWRTRRAAAKTDAIEADATEAEDRADRHSRPSWRRRPRWWRGKSQDRRSG